ncbi:MAG TPA: GNAT family N-acetyltransferase [Acidimicrobiales bacterium]|nr:GNAT family N-acetyltransferase [Acidimicrobiales bacterium]
MIAIDSAGARHGVEVATIDPTDTAAFDEWYAVLAATDEERWPGQPGWQHAERLAKALDLHGPQENRCLVARRRGESAVVGIASVILFRRENRDLAQVEVRVPPEHRRRGVGTAIVDAAAGVARAAGRTVLTGRDEVPVRQDWLDAAGPFARRLGFTPVQRDVRRRLDLPPDPARADALRADPRATPAGYSMLTFADRWPDEYIEDRCVLGHRMSTDVPMGEQDLEAEEWDEFRVRAMEAMLAAQNRAKVTTAARHEGTRRLVAFTEVAVPLGAPESAWQHDTLVLREHRGHGLGFAVKVANLWAVLEWHPAVRTISTWNAADNTRMIAVNEAMGFDVVADSTSWRKALDG